MLFQLRIFLFHLTYKLSLRASVMRVGAPRVAVNESSVPIEGLDPDLFLSFLEGVQNAILCSSGREAQNFECAANVVESFLQYLGNFV